MLANAYRYTQGTRGEYIIQVPATVMLEFVVVADDSEAAMDQIYQSDSRYPFVGRDGSTEMFGFGDTSIRVKSLSLEDSEITDFEEYDESGVM